MDDIISRFNLPLTLISVLNIVYFTLNIFRLEVSNSKMRIQVDQYKSQGNSSEMNKNKIFQTLQSQIERGTFSFISQWYIFYLKVLLHVLTFVVNLLSFLAEKQQIIFATRYEEAVAVIDKLKPAYVWIFFYLFFFSIIYDEFKYFYLVLTSIENNH